MYAQLCSSENAIFTSVVVYSRTTVINTKNHNQRVLLLRLFVILVLKCSDNFLRIKRKKTEYTHKCAQLCSSVCSIFTVVVIFSSTTQENKSTSK